jgi:hypothetical protein
MKERRESLTKVLRNGSSSSSSSSSGACVSSTFETPTTAVSVSACNATNNAVDQTEGAPPSTGSGSTNVVTGRSGNDDDSDKNKNNSNLITNVALKKITLRPSIATAPRKLPPLFTPLESAAITKQLNDSIQQRRDRIFRMSLSGGENSSSTCCSTSKVTIVTTSTMSTTSGGNHQHQRVATKSPHSQGTVVTADSSTTDGLLSASSSSSSPDDACAAHNDEEEGDASSSCSTSAAAPAPAGGGSFTDGARQDGLTRTSRTPSQQQNELMEGVKGPPVLQEIKERLVESLSSDNVDTSVLLKSTSSSKAGHTITDDGAVSSSSSARLCRASTLADSSRYPAVVAALVLAQVFLDKKEDKEVRQDDSGPAEENHVVGSSPSKRRIMQKPTDQEAVSILAASRDDHPSKITATRRIDGHTQQQQQQHRQQQHESPSRSPMVPPAVVHCTAPCFVKALRMEKTDDMTRTNTPPKQAKRQMKKDDTPRLTGARYPRPGKAVGDVLHGDVETIRKRLVELKEIKAETPPKQKQQPQQNQSHQEGDTNSVTTGLIHFCAKDQDEEDEEAHNCADYMPETYSPQKSKRKPTLCSTKASSKSLSATKRNIEKSSQSISPHKKSSSRRPPATTSSPNKRTAGIALVQGHERHSRLLQTLQKVLAEQNTGNEDSTEEDAAERKQKYDALARTLQETVEDLAELYAQAKLVADDAPSDTLESDGGGADWIMSDESSFDCTTDGSNTSGWVSQEGESSKIDSILQYDSDHEEEEEGGEGTDSDTPTDQSGSESTSSSAVPMIELSDHTLEPVLEESVVESSSCSVEEGHRMLLSRILSQEGERASSFRMDLKTAETNGANSKPDVIVLVSKQVQVCRAQGGLYKVASKSCGALNGVFSMTESSPAVVVVRSVPVHRSEDYLLLSAEVRCGTQGSLLDLACQTSLDLQQYLAAKKSELARRQVMLPCTTNSGRKQWRIKARGGHYHIAVWTGLCYDLILHHQLPPPALSLQQPDSSQKDLAKKKTTFGTTARLVPANLDLGSKPLMIPPETVTDEQCGAYGGLFHLATKTQVHEEANSSLSCSF